VLLRVAEAPCGPVTVELEEQVPLAQLAEPWRVAVWPAGPVTLPWVVQAPSAQVVEPWRVTAPFGPWTTPDEAQVPPAQLCEALRLTVPRPVVTEPDREREAAEASPAAASMRTAARAVTLRVLNIIVSFKMAALVDTRP
jgi:hypothetical protein